VTALGERAGKLLRLLDQAVSLLDVLTERPPAILTDHRSPGRLVAATVELDLLY
jgi:hypothetical protein